MNTGKKLVLTNVLLEDISSALNENSWEFEWYLDLEKEQTVFFSEYHDMDEEIRELIEKMRMGSVLCLFRTALLMKDGSRWSGLSMN